MAFLKHLEQSDLLVSGQRNLDVYLVAVLARLNDDPIRLPDLDELSLCSCHAGILPSDPARSGGHDGHFSPLKAQDSVHD
jgi:hypothetical protein